MRRDAFRKREKANEDYAIRMREKEKLMELKKKLAAQQAHLKVLEDSMLVLPCVATQNFRASYMDLDSLLMVFIAVMSLRRPLVASKSEYHLVTQREDGFTSYNAEGHCKYS
jgi:hypothetical protein